MHPSIPKSGNVYWERERERERERDHMHVRHCAFHSYSVRMIRIHFGFKKDASPCFIEDPSASHMISPTSESLAQYITKLERHVQDIYFVSELGNCLRGNTIRKCDAPVFQSLLKTMIFEYASTIWNKQQVHWGDPGQHLGRWLPFLHF